MHNHLSPMPDDHSVNHCCAYCESIMDLDDLIQNPSNRYLKNICPICGEEVCFVAVYDCV